LRRWIGFSEDDERVRRTRSTFGAGRVDLPATAFNQYNVPCVAAILLFEPIGFTHILTKGCAAK
jgi:hypothetical protein